MHRFPNMTLFDKNDHTNMRIDQTTDIQSLMIIKHEDE